MKKLLLITAFAVFSTMVFANNLEPVKNAGDKQLTVCNYSADLSCAPCAVYTGCHGFVYSLPCNCSVEDCANKAIALHAILCIVSPDCCYVISPGGNND